MDTVVITGAAGLIGSALVRQFSSMGATVVAVVKQTLPSELPGVSYVLWSELADAVRNRPISTLFHCAATHPTSNTEATPSGLASGNLALTQILTSQFTTRQIQRLIYLSSLSVYGADVVGSLHEDGPLGNPDLYGQAKRQTEIFLQQSSVAHSTLVLRLAGILAQGNLKPLPGRWLQRLQQGLTLEISGATAPYNHGYLLDDLVQLCVHAHQQTLAHFITMNVASSEPIPVREAAEMVLKAAQRPPSDMIIRAENSQHGAASTTKLAELLGSAPRTTRDTLATYLQLNGYSL